jgi:hypothetical protein
MNEATLYACILKDTIAARCLGEGQLLLRGVIVSNVIRISVSMRLGAKA